MSLKGIELVLQDIKQRFDKIIFHIEERDKICPQFSSYTSDDHKPDSSKRSDLEKLILKTTSEEISALYELVHLMDNIKKLFKLLGKSEKNISVIEKNKSYRMAANFVNTHKHGVRGRNQKSAYIAFYVEFFRASTNQYINAHPVINLDGNLKKAGELIRELIKVWLSFLKKYTDINLASFEVRYSAIIEKEANWPVYVVEVPGIDEWAKKDADERKKIDI
jgi:hypothetical protein